MADEQAGVEKVADLIRDIRTCMLTTINHDGQLLSRPMVVQQVRFDGDLWFVADGGSDKVTQIQHWDTPPAQRVRRRHRRDQAGHRQGEGAAFRPRGEPDRATRLQHPPRGTDLHPS